MTALNAREAYRLWAPTYADETAISHLDSELVAALTPPLFGLALLDAGCGTGRRLRASGAALAVGVDLSPEMLEAGASQPGPADHRTMIGDVRQLPLADGAFDVVWCRLVIGHLSDCAPAYAELARVSRPGARLIVTDFHPDAYAAGHRRSFRSQDRVHEAEHFVHTAAMQIAAARAAGLRLIGTREARIGPSVQAYYERAGRAALYPAHQGLNVVLALAFRREA